MKNKAIILFILSVFLAAALSYFRVDAHTTVGASAIMSFAFIFLFASKTIVGMLDRAAHNIRSGIELAEESKQNALNKAQALKQEEAKERNTINEIMQNASKVNVHMQDAINQELKDNRERMQKMSIDNTRYKKEKYNIIIRNVIKNNVVKIIKESLINRNTSRSPQEMSDDIDRVISKLIQSSN